jgi:protein SCO1/2
MALLVCAYPAQAQAFRPSDMKPPILRNVGLDQKLNAQVPLDAQFRDENGQTVRLSDYFSSGKPAILDLVYYQCPMLCGEGLIGLARALKGVSFTAGREFQVITISIDPTETPELARAKKKIYVERYGRAEADQGWHFLTGDKKEIDTVASAVGFRYTYDASAKQYAHPATIVLLSPEGKVTQYYPGIEYGPRDLKLGLVEASNRKIGSIIDDAVLFCYHYDAQTGKYTPAVWKAVRAGGAVTVIGLAVLIGVLIRQDPNRAKGRKA